MLTPRFSVTRSSRPSTPSSRRAARRRRPAIEILEGRELLSTFAVSSTADSGAAASVRPSSIRIAPPPPRPAPTSSRSRTSPTLRKSSSSPRCRSISQPVIIDGTTEGSYNGTHPFVQLIGNYAGGSALGLDITASGTQVKALAIDGFNAGGVLIDNASNVVLNQDYVGIDPANNAMGIDVNGNIIYEGNGVYGVTIQSENGGTATGDVLSSDVVSANSYNGIILSGTSTTKNVVSGTIIGSDNTGAAVVDDPGNALGNGQHGGGGSGVVINRGLRTTPSAARRPPPATSSWATRATASTSPTATQPTTSSWATPSAPTSPAARDDGSAI